MDCVRFRSGGRALHNRLDDIRRIVLHAVDLLLTGKTSISCAGNGCNSAFGPAVSLAVSQAS